MNEHNDISISSVALSSISTKLLQAELIKRQEEDTVIGRPECGSGGANASYNTSLHVGALVLILVLSTLACSFPIVARRFPKLPIPHRFLFLSRHFGTGVLIATAFVHLLPTAFTSLTDPCLPAFWTDGYPAMAGLIAMVAVLAVVGIEMFFAIRGAGHIHGTDYDMLDANTAVDQEAGPIIISKAKPASIRSSLRHFRTSSFGYDNPRWEDERPDRSNNNTTSIVPSLPAQQPLSGSRHDHASDEDSDLELDDFDPAFQTSNRRSTSDSTTNSPFINGSSTTHLNTPPSPNPNTLSPTHQTDENPNSSALSLTAQKAHEEQKLLLQCLLLEAGILFHSIFIGMALSVASGPSFIVLLIAISFHQTFEGLALGSRISAITSFGPVSLKPWLMALAYGTTTPIGQAIGLAVHNLYDPESQTGLLMVGVMNAISSGLLLFAGLVELLAEDFLSDQSYESLQGPKRLQACGSVVAGSLLMALVGAWA